MEIDPERFRKLMDSLVKLLTHYEEELTAWYLGYRHLEKNPTLRVSGGEFHAMMSKVLAAPGLKVEAEAEYVELEPLLRPIDPQDLSEALDRATAAIDRLSKKRK